MYSICLVLTHNCVEGQPLELKEEAFGRVVGNQGREGPNSPYIGLLVAHGIYQLNEGGTWCSYFVTIAQGIGGEHLLEEAAA